MKISEVNGYKVIEKDNGTVIKQAIPSVIEAPIEKEKEETQLDRIEKKLDQILKG